MMGALLIVAIVASLLVRLPAELAESHKELVRTQKIRSEEEAVSAAKAAYQKASEVLAPEYAPKPDAQATTAEAKSEATDSAQPESSEETASAVKPGAAVEAQSAPEAQAQEAAAPSQDAPGVKPEPQAAPAPESQSDATQAEDKSEAKAETKPSA